MLLKQTHYLILALIIFTASSLVSAEINWKVSPSRTIISFKVNHFVLMEVEGHFRDPQGQVITKNEEDFSNAQLEASIPVKTIDTGNEDRDTHLKKEVFFYADKYPNMQFKSKSVVKKSETEYEMLGNLTIRGTTLPITFKVENLGITTSKKGVTRSKFIARGSVDRYQFGLKWNEITEAGAMVVGENVAIEMDVTLEKMDTTLASR